MLVMLALATHVTVAQADTTITQTAITSPSDPSYFYDASDGASDSTGTTAGFTVTGTTNSSDPSSDTVDIDCYDDNGSQPDTYTDYDTYPPTTPYAVGTLVTNVSLNSDGSFSAFVPFSSIENDPYPDDGACRLRAVPAGTTPDTGLSSFGGPRVLLSDLSLDYQYPNGALLDDYQLNSPELGAINDFNSAGDCGLQNVSLASTSYFSEANPSTFGCSDGYDQQDGLLTVDGQYAYGPYQEGYVNTASLSVSASENTSNGDLTIHEVEPLEFQSCSDESCSAPPPTGVVDDRTIQEANQGRVILVTDTFKSVDGQSHQVVDDIGSSVELNNSNLYHGDGDILFEFPGQDGYQPYTSTDSVDVGSAPGTIYAYNDDYPDGSTSEGRAAITFYTTPSASVGFPGDTGEEAATDPVIPYTLNLSPGGSSSISLAYATEFSQSSFAGDLASELNMPIPPSISITSPSGNSTTHSTSATVTGVVTAPAGVESVIVNGVTAAVSGGSFTASVPLTAGSNTIAATVTSDNGQIAATSETLTYDPASSTPGVTPALSAEYSPVLGPIAVTGSAKRAGRVKETLKGEVTAGSAKVSYYFAYGRTTHYGQRTKTLQMSAGSSRRSVTLTATKLAKGVRYHYRLVVTGASSQATGLGRSFKVAR